MASSSFKRSMNLDIVAPINDSGLLMKKSDWNKIKRSIEKIPEPSKFLSNIYSMFFGASLSGFLTIISLIGNKNLSAWIFPSLIIGSIAALIMGFIILKVDQSRGHERNASVKELKTEMEEIEKLYPDFK
ncbi:MAG: hypothetical protein Q8R47_04360 [Nanoarchaeota archaeon]|nr:hypothetical protein [Nanoarchaeota archaeon]